MKKIKTMFRAFFLKQLNQFQPKYALQVFTFLAINWTAIMAPLTYAIN